MRVHTFTALSVATVPVPASVDGHHPAERHLASIGLFTAVVTGNRWRFYTNGAAIGAAQPEWLLLRWLHDNLPEPASLIGYQLDSHVLAALTSAAATAPAETAHRSMTSLATALRTGAIDVALDWGGALAPPLVDIAADHGIGTSITTDEQRASHWAFGDVDQLREDAADQALGLWRVFLRMATLSGLHAEAATEDWLQRRRRLRSVTGGRARMTVRKRGEGKSPASNTEGE